MNDLSALYTTETSGSFLFRTGSPLQRQGYPKKLAHEYLDELLLHEFGRLSLVVSFSCHDPVPIVWAELPEEAGV